VNSDSKEIPDITPETVCQIVSGCIGYYFRNPGLPLEALTHKSHFNEHPTDVGYNERLEFLGDAVLDLIVADALMKMLPLAPEGQLSLARSTLVNEDNLAEIGDQLQIGRLVLLGRGEEKNNGRSKASIVSNAVEALVGAIFLDSDFDTTREVVISWFSGMLSAIVTGSRLYDAKTELQETLQARLGTSPVYSVVAVSGPDHEKMYEVEIAVNGDSVARGEGRSKKDAEKNAARNALQTFKESEQ